MQPLDLRRVVQDTATLLRNSTEFGDRHSVEVDLACDEVRLDADENQIRQVVWNLASNGLRAMPNGGVLHLAAGVDNAEGGRAGVLIVTDEGVGIPADEIDKIFQPFRGSFGKGSGLGLAIVYRIVSDYNAKIDVQSQPGRGTTFRVNFPPARDQQSAPSRDSVQQVSS
jgi:signal transduction histidine kinase